jgi:hypothetical protein
MLMIAGAKVCRVTVADSSRRLLGLADSECRGSTLLNVVHYNRVSGHARVSSPDVL